MHHLPQVAAPLHVEPELRAVAEHAGEFLTILPNELSRGAWVVSWYIRRLFLGETKWGEVAADMPETARDTGAASLSGLGFRPIAVRLL